MGNSSRIFFYKNLPGNSLERNSSEKSSRTFSGSLLGIPTEAFSGFFFFIRKLLFAFLQEFFQGFLNDYFRISSENSSKDFFKTSSNDHSKNSLKYFPRNYSNNLYWEHLQEFIQESLWITLGILPRIPIHSRKGYFGSLWRIHPEIIQGFIKSSKTQSKTILKTFNLLGPNSFVTPVGFIAGVTWGLKLSPGILPRVFPGML